MACTCPRTTYQILIHVINLLRNHAYISQYSQNAQWLTFHMSYVGYAAMYLYTVSSINVWQRVFAVWLVQASYTGPATRQNST